MLEKFQGPQTEMLANVAVMHARQGFRHPSETCFDQPVRPNHSFSFL